MRIYGEYAHRSFYVPARDGVRLAANVLHPVRDGRPLDAPLPVLWAYDRYHHAYLREPERGAHPCANLLVQMPWLLDALGRGYVVAVVDIRGTGASFGAWPGPFSAEEAADTYDVTEWLAAQPFCNGAVGMFGRSYLGIVQYLAAAMAPPHLRAVFPEMALFDLYAFGYSGGVFREDFAAGWTRSVVDLDVLRPAEPVGEGVEGERELARAVAEHRGNVRAYDRFAGRQHRDSPGGGDDGARDAALFAAHDPAAYLERINRSHVAIYHLAGWYDLWPRDALLWFKNLRVSQRILLGPWCHAGGAEADLGAERLRWFDHWLKGVANGAMAGPPVRYFVMGAPGPAAWRGAREWPPPGQRRARYYLRAGPSGSVASANDGALGLEPPAGEDDARDEYAVDYGTSSGTETRWTNGYGGGFGYRDMSPNDARGLTYTTAPLATALEVVGHPVVRLWVSSSAPDGDFFVYLEDVDAHGFSQYVTEGVLRASHRATAAPPYDNLGLPFHRGAAADVRELEPGGAPVELVFDLHPTAFAFRAGHRVRVTITCADRDNARTPELAPPPRVGVHRGGRWASSIELPLGDDCAARAAAPPDAPEATADRDDEVVYF